MANSRPQAQAAFPMGPAKSFGVRLSGAADPHAVIVGASVVMLGLGAVNVLIVPFVIDTLQASEGWFGPLRAAQVVSMILAGSGLALLSGRFRSEALISAGLVGIGLSVGNRHSSPSGTIRGLMMLCCALAFQPAEVAARART